MAQGRDLGEQPQDREKDFAYGWYHDGTNDAGEPIAEWEDDKGMSFETYDEALARIAKDVFGATKNVHEEWLVQALGEAGFDVYRSENMFEVYTARERKGEDIAASIVKATGLDKVYEAEEKAAFEADLAGEHGTARRIAAEMTLDQQQYGEQGAPEVVLRITQPDAEPYTLTIDGVTVPISRVVHDGAWVDGEEVEE